MEVVQPDHVRIVVSYLTEKPGGGGFGTEASGAKDAMPQGVETVIPDISDGHGGDGIVRAAPPVGDAAGMPLLFQPTAGGENDFSRTAVACHGVDEEIFHVSSLPSSCRKRLTYCPVQISGV